MGAYTIAMEGVSIDLFAVTNAHFDCSTIIRFAMGKSCAPFFVIINCNNSNFNLKVTLY